MSQPQLNDFSPHLPSCWGNSDHNATICEYCVQAELQPAYHVLRMGDLLPHRDSKAVDGSEFSFSSSITGSTCSPRTSPGSTSPNHFTQTQVLLPTDSDTTYYKHDILVPIAEDPDDNHTPSTVPDSRGHTPPPMQTPPNMSFSNHLAYIDQKLTDHVSSLTKRQFPNHTPRFPPGLTPQQNAVVPLSQRPTLIQMEQQFITYPQSRSLSGVRRTRSKMLRDEAKPTPPETDALDPSNEADQESDAKRRKLCRHDSTASAHTFIAKEPASLRKARSLVAGDVGSAPQPVNVSGVGQLRPPPIVVPSISPRDAALARLRALLSREAKQRTDDIQMMIAAERPNSLSFDNEIHLLAVEWLLSVRGPAGDECKSLRRHLRASLETRFHAAWLFSRYAIRMKDARFNPFLMPQYGEKEDPYQRQLREKLVDEIALGCLAIAAKFHHDFLSPLRPLTAEQFLYILGDEHPIAFDDFELMQNTILKSFNYIVYQPTPQAYLQEIWKVCSTLQGIQDGNLHLWHTEVQARALEFIETCLHEQDTMSYPVGHLTAGALLEALHVQELHKQCLEHSDSQFWEQHADEQIGNGPRVCVACVSNEICDAMGIERNALLGCRDWIMTVWVGEITEQ